MKFEGLELEKKRDLNTAKKIVEKDPNIQKELKIPNVDKISDEKFI